MGDRTDAFGEATDQIHAIVVASNKCVKMNKGAVAWRDYIDYLNGVVCDGFVKNIAASLHALSQNVDTENIKANDWLPLLQITLNLEMSGASKGDVVFEPDLDASSKRSNLRSMLVYWMRDYQGMFNMMKRLCTGNGSYCVELEERIELRDGVENVCRHLTRSVDDCMAYRAVFMKYSHLWTKDLQEAFKEWWNEVAVIPEVPKSAEELAAEAAAADEGEGGGKKEEVVEEEPKEADKYPPLAAFQAKITEYSQIRQECNALHLHEDIGWLRVDSKPVRQQLLYWAGQWETMYTDFLRTKIISSMEKMTEFTAACAEQFNQEVPDGDEDALRCMLEKIRDVKKLAKTYDNMVEPLRAETAMLKKFGITVPDSTLVAMDEAPDLWDTVKNKMFSVKEGLNDQYNREGDKIKSKALKFTKEVMAFREKFQKDAPFKFAVGLEGAYAALEEQWVGIAQFNNDSAALREL